MHCDAGHPNLRNNKCTGCDKKSNTDVLQCFALLFNICPQIWVFYHSSGTSAVVLYRQAARSGEALQRVQLVCHSWKIELKKELGV
eukprot:1766171-Amphidinium_carterae.1